MKLRSKKDSNGTKRQARDSPASTETMPNKRKAMEDPGDSASKGDIQEIVPNKRKATEDGDSASKGDIRWELICPICNDELTHSVVAQDKQRYCRGCIEGWLVSCSEREQPAISPFTREPMKVKLRDCEAPLDAHFQEAGANIPSILKLREAFSQLDPLRDVLAASLEGWKPPQVVMIGDESSGKSTILERLAMMPIFPRGDDLTTRLPIHLRLRYAESSLPPRLEVIDSATGTTVKGPYVIPSVSGHVDVREQMDAIIQEENRGERGVSSTRCIVLHIANRHVPSIDLVDLPGLVATGVSSAETKALVEAHIAQNDSRSMYLLTCPASVAPNTSLAVDIVVKNNLQARTIGIFTMCDEASSTRQRNLLVQRLSPDAPAEGGAVRLEPHGWVAAMNEPLGEANAFKRLRQQALAEAKWFAGVVPENLTARAGCGAVMERLGALFQGYLLQSWGPTTVKMLEAKLEDTVVGEVLLGRPALKGEPARARSLASEETRRVLASPASLQAIDRVLAGLLQELRAQISEELKDVGTQRAMHAFVTEWTTRRAAVETLCRTAAGEWPQLLADAVVKELEAGSGAPTLPATPEELRAMVDTPPFVLTRFPAFIKTLHAEFRAHFETRARAALSVVESHLKPFFDGSSAFTFFEFSDMDAAQLTTPVQVHMSPQSPQGQRLSGGVTFAFMCALSVGECPGDVLERAAAALRAGDWDEACNHKRSLAIQRQAELKRAHSGVVKMMCVPGVVGSVNFLRNFGGGCIDGTRGVAVDLLGNIVVAQNSVTGLALFDSLGGNVARFSMPEVGQVMGLTRDGKGNIIVSCGAQKVVVFKPGGGLLKSSDVAATLPGAPHGMAVDASGNFWVAEGESNRVAVLGPKGDFLRALPRLTNPIGVAVDQLGKVYVTEAGKQHVTVFGPDGKVVRRFGEGVLSSDVRGVAVDGAGDVLVVDRGNKRVAVFGPTGVFVKSFGGGTLSGPEFVAVDAVGKVYVSEANQVAVFG